MPTQSARLREIVGGAGVLNPWNPFEFQSDFSLLPQLVRFVSPGGSHQVANATSRPVNALAHCRLKVFVMNTAIWPRVFGLPGQ